MLLLKNYIMKASDGVKSEIEFLSPQRETLETKGKLTYNEGDRAFTNLKYPRTPRQQSTGVVHA